ncbi:hypothetical protein DL95DRAFT_397347, partial [Leptodontidium sp. 2 PMI_412]
MSNQKTEAMSLATGSNVEGSAIDSDGSRALHHSVRIGYTELVEVLADRGSGWKSCNEYRQCHFIGLHSLEQLNLTK